MAQIFSPSADTWLRLVMVVVVAGGTVALLAAGGYVRSDYSTAVNWVVEQPVPFSHQHHVQDVGLDCRYCHATVETSPEAGYPSTHTCMTCHSQIWTNADVLAPVRQSLATGKPLQWRRVAVLPDYVYFSHEIHVRGGIGCESCHGHIEKMPLTSRAQPFEMRWCLDCHRDPATRIRPRDQITNMNWPETGPRDKGLDLMALNGVHTKGLTDCYTCHR